MRNTPIFAALTTFLLSAACTTTRPSKKVTTERPKKPVSDVSDEPLSYGLMDDGNYDTAILRRGKRSRADY